MSVTYILTLIAWIFFRAQSVSDAFLYLGKIFSFTLLAKPSIFPAKAQLPPDILAGLIIIFFSIEWFQRDKQHALQIDNIKVPRTIRWAVYSFLIFIIGMYLPSGESPFIYFQF